MDNREVYLRICICTCIQWNPSIAATLGEQHFGRYIGVVAFIEGLFCTQTVHLGPGCLAVISQLAFIHAGVAVKRGSTVW